MRLIDADAIKKLDWITERGMADCGEEFVYLSAIDKMPTVDAEPIRRGSWIFIRDEGGGNSLYSCSECGQGDIQSPEVVVPYCWHCGAKMEAEK